MGFSKVIQKILEKIRTKGNSIKTLFKGQKHTNSKGLLKNPLFYFGLLSLFLLSTVCFESESLTDLSGMKNSEVVFFNEFFNKAEAVEKDDLFFSKNQILALETPDLKIVQDNTVGGVAPPRILTTQVLGTIFGETNQNKKEIIEYAVEPGDTPESIAKSFDISLETVLWANDLTSKSKLKVGDKLVILPTSGIVYVVKNGDTLSEISSTYKSKVSDIVAFNDLSNEGDIFIGDIIVVPGGVMPKKASPAPTQTQLASSFFIFPTEGKITQGIHWSNGVDTANKCGTPVYAAAPGQVLRARYGWNMGGGNLVTILHSNGVVTYYGHLMTILVKQGDRVDVGDRIGLMGGGPGMAGAGISTGCHLHFQVTGAKNPLAKYAVGSYIKYSK